MAERLLFNLFASMIPVVAYQLIMLRASYDRESKNTHLIVGTLAGLSTIICMMFPIVSGNGFLWDLRWVPFLLAIIYGRFSGGVICTAVMLIDRLFLGGLASWLEVAVDAFIIFVVVSTLVPCKSNDEVWGKRKTLVHSLLLSGGTYCFVMFTIYLYFAYRGKAAFFLGQGVWFYVMYLIVFMAAYTASVALIENLFKQEMLREELQNAEKLHLLSDMAASFAHEIRNPLTVATGFIQLTNESLDNQQQKDNMQFVTSELKRAEEIISEYLNFARPEPTVPEVVSIPDSLDRIVTTMGPFATLHQVAISLDAEPLLHVLFDDGKFKQVMLNLIKNAIEAIPDGGHIHVRSRLQGEWVMIEVADDGVGMTGAELRRAGTPFYSTKTQGTGLGLMVTFQLVKAMHGRLRFKSSPGEGTTAILQFAAYRGQPDIRNSPEQPG